MVDRMVLPNRYLNRAYIWKNDSYGSNTGTVGENCRIENYEILLAIKENLDFHEQYPLEGPYDFLGATEEEREELIAWDKAEEIDERIVYCKRNTKN